MTPTGLVTFLFTDIEGSTKLSQEFPDSLHAALEKHNSILRNAGESNNGFVFKIIGDTFCCAFENAVDAVKAAVEIQIDLVKEKWDEAVIKVRIGIHSGNAEWNGNDYMGYITLARTARIMDAAYGKQILISNDTYKLFSHHSHHKDTKTQRENESNSLCLSDLVVKNVCFRDLGERRLKDVIQPIRLYQVECEGLKKEFPPLKTLDARPNNLPIQLTSFIGREKEMKFVKNFLKQCPLLTLTGTGGAGKTRLALQTAADLVDDFTNGVWFVDLAAVSDKYLLPQVFLDSLGIAENATAAPEDTLKEYLTDKELLIILDNCEHLIDASAELTEKLLSTCPGLKIIATSREALNCSGEQTYNIPSLTNPDINSKVTPEQLTKYESARLFIERALSVKPDFRVNTENAHALAEICTSLDGVPLAIELAAARIKSLSVEKIHKKLDDRLNLLTGGKRTALPRQQTLRELIDWSYDLLTEEEKILCSRLSVFAGGWTLEAAEEVCSDELINKNVILDLLCLLTEKSIIVYNEKRERYRILESIRQYGKEKLENENELKLKHLDYFLKFSETAKTELICNDDILWLDKLESDHSNFQSAIEWSAIHNNAEKGALCAAALGRFWDIRGHISIGIRLLEIIMIRSDDLSISAKAKVLRCLGIFAYQKGSIELAQKYFDESLLLSSEINYESGIAYSLCWKGVIAHDQGNYEMALKYSEESLSIFKLTDKKSGVIDSLINIGNISRINGSPEKAEKYYEEGLELSRDSGEKRTMVSCLHNLGVVSSDKLKFDKSVKFFEEGLKISKEMKFKTIMAYFLTGLGYVFMLQKNYEKALDYFKESLMIAREIGNKIVLISTLDNLATIFLHYKNFSISVKILCVVCTSLNSMGISSENNIQYEKDETIAKLHNFLSDEEFDKYWEVGKKLTMEETCQLIINN